MAGVAWDYYHPLAWGEASFGGRPHFDSSDPVHIQLYDHQDGQSSSPTLHMQSLDGTVQFCQAYCPALLTTGDREVWMDNKVKRDRRGNEEKSDHKGIISHYKGQYDEDLVISG